MHFSTRPMTRGACHPMARSRSSWWSAMRMARITARSALNRYKGGRTVGRPPGELQRPMRVTTAEQKRKEGGFAETVRVVIHALLIAVVIRTFLFQPFNIPSGSMMATLLIGDYLFV